MHFIKTILRKTRKFDYFKYNVRLYAFLKLIVIGFVNYGVTKNRLIKTIFVLQI